MFRLSILSTVLRYYLMMAVVIVAVYTHSAWLVALAMAIAVSAVLGYRIGGEAGQESKVIRMKAAPGREQRKAG